MHQDVLRTTNDVSNGKRLTQPRGERDLPFGPLSGERLGSDGLFGTGDIQRPHHRLEVVSELRDRSTKRGVGGRQRGLEDRVLDLLGQGATLTRAKLRDSLGVKNGALGRGAGVTGAAGRLCRTPAGWQRLD